MSKNVMLRNLGNQAKMLTGWDKSRYDNDGLINVLKDTVGDI